jgi:hypothetical protein
VLFFFPFALEPASQSLVDHKPLPMLPASRGRREAERAAETAFADMIGQGGNLTADLLRRALIAMTSSLTALGNQANLLFSQIAATLAFDRMARQAASFFGTSWPPFAPYLPHQMWAAGLWPAPFQNTAWYSAAATPAWPANFWANPWPGLTEAFTAWANIWMPAVPQHRPSSSASDAKAPFSTTLSAPGFSWSVTLG